MMTTFSFFRASRFVLGLLVLLLSVSSCLNNNNDNDDYLADLERQAAQAKIDDEATIQKYLADNKIKKFDKRTSGLYFVQDSTALGTGDMPKAGQTVSVRYTGYFFSTPPKAFDASGSTPFQFTIGIGRVIAGWDEGIALMRKGSKATLLVPSALAYGVFGYSTIPPNTPLRFEVELIDIK
ncbi:FKBP-type peptidyl-prolyl cis-trans isomerase [Hymenobacter aerilatus]|uniref:Peptidyl-prolyl cis-trans isomerase n=1 Tax=Hymenobacter aerilatus TaxID=2932251 RepID=A0A8T9SVG1_9BACT|nr:FKBP-type peptidyl-prolyl cis-trans isomerase [Hymenobacter aerilatus]UOR04230.1 FKBP-type peptidyl-prolyl cis-trans isomerase [Hymenobacter aerilatus]